MIPPRFGNWISLIGRRRSTALYHSISDRVTETGVEKREFYGWETKCNWVFVALLTPKSTRSASVCPCLSRANFVFANRTTCSSVHPLSLPALRSLLPLFASFSVSLFSPFSLSFSLSLLPSHILHLWIHTPLRTHATGARLVNYNKKASSFRRFAHDWLRCLIKEFIRHRNPRRFRRLDVRSRSGYSRVRSS